jgi:hypothetical protein
MSTAAAMEIHAPVSVASVRSLLVVGLREEDGRGEEEERGERENTRLCLRSVRAASLCASHLGNRL